MSGAMQRTFYTPSWVGGYEWVMPNGEDYTEIHRLNGDARTAEWQPMPVQFVRTDDDERALRVAVTPWLNSSVVVLKDAAIARLRPVLRMHGELLPLVSPNAELEIFTATRRLAVLDKERSEIVRFDSGGIMAVPRLVMRTEDIPDDVHAFMLTELDSGPLLLSEELVRQITAVTTVDGIEFEEATSL